MKKLFGGLQTEILQLKIEINSWHVIVLYAILKNQNWVKFIKLPTADSYFQGCLLKQVLAVSNGDISAG